MERPQTPDTFDTVRALMEQFAEEMHTAFPAKVQSYDATTQTADLVPLVKQAVLQSDGSYVLEAMPVLPTVPIMWMRAGGASITLPLVQGDMVLVVCCESAIGSLRVSAGGSPQPPGDMRRFNLSHAVALPVFFTRATKLAHASATDVVIGFDGDAGMRIAIKPDHSMVVTQGTTQAFQIAADGTVNLSASHALNVARATDPVGPSVAMAAFMSAVAGYINAIAPGTVVIPPGAIGSITSGNPNVNA